MSESDSNLPNSGPAEDSEVPPDRSEFTAARRAGFVSHGTVAVQSWADSREGKDSIAGSVLLNNETHRFDHDSDVAAGDLFEGVVVQDGHKLTEDEDDE